MTSIHSLEVVLTARCNLSCTYCYQNDKNARRMEWRTLRAGLDKLLASTEPQLRVLFIGGEPLLEFPLMQRAVDYVDGRLRAGQSIDFSISTNGMLVGRDHARFLDERGFQVQLSFDGVPAAQSLRGKGTYEVVDRLLDRLRVAHPGLFHERLRIAITVPVSTLVHLADSVDYLMGKGVSGIAIQPAILPHETWSAAHHEELERQFARIFERSKEHFELTGEVPVECLRKTVEASRHRPAGRSLCGVGRGEALAIDVDGEVSGCVTFAGSFQKLPPFLEERIAPTRLGHIDSPGLDDRLALYPEAIRAAEIFDNQQDNRSSYGHCASCRHLGQCSVCPMTIGYQASNDDPNRIPDYACAFNLVSLDCRARFPRQPSATEILTGTAPMPESMRLLERHVTAARRASLSSSS